MTGLPAHANRDHDAALWAARTISGALSSQDISARDAWLDAEAANREAYDRVMDAHDLAREAASLPEILAIRREALNAVPETSPQTPLWRWAIAACALLAVGVTSALFLRPALPDEGRIISAQTVARDYYETGIGERLSATLSDGSVITLNTASAVRIHFTRGARRIELIRGQALFTVAHNRDRPFLVEAGAQSVRALGTRFEVRRRDDGLEVVLVEGLVAVGRREALRSGDLTHAVRMQAGERLTAASSAAIEVAPANVEALTSWTSGRIIFSATRLDEAIAEINRYRRHPLIIDDPEVAALEISGAYRIADAERFGEALFPTLPVAQETRDNGGARLVMRDAPAP